MPVLHSEIAKSGRPQLVTLEKCLDVFSNVCHASHHKCDPAHRQGVTEHPFQKRCGACEMKRMHDSFPIERVRAAIARMMARSKGRSAVGWFVLGIFFGPLAILGIAIASKDYRAAQPAFPLALIKSVTNHICAIDMV